MCCPQRNLAREHHIHTHHTSHISITHLSSHPVHLHQKASSNPAKCHKEGVAIDLTCRGMVKDEASRVDFGMAEALAFGTLALHRGVRPQDTDPGSDDQPQEVVVHPGGSRHQTLTSKLPLDTLHHMLVSLPANR